MGTVIVNEMSKKLSTIMRKTAVVAAVVATFSVQAQAQVELNFTDARIDAVASSVGAMVGKNVIVDPKVKGTLTLVSDQPVTQAQALAQLREALRLHGVVLLESGNVLKVVPEADAKTHATSVNSAAATGEVTTRIFHLNHENAANVLAVVKPLVSSSNVVNINPGNNTLVVTDYAENIARIGRLIANLDKPSTSDLEILPLEHAMASEMVALLQRLMDADVGATAQVPGGLRSTFLADNRSNALIVRAANREKLAQIRSLVARLDQPALQSATSAGNIHVVYLKHADALVMAETLRAAIQTLEQTAPGQELGKGQTSGGATGGRTAPATAVNTNTSNLSGNTSDGGLTNAAPISLGQTQMPSTGGLVQADPNTNSLIITAPAPLFRQLRAVIDKLDERRAQVLVESMIVEVADNKLAEFGVQWQAAMGKDGGTLGAIGTNSNVTGSNILNVMAGLASGKQELMAQALGSLGGGMNFAVAPKILGQYYLGALANFLQRDGSTNILSKPNIMTLDNQEARIIIGNNVPFVTGSYATTGSGGAVNPFTTVERKDVGLMLRIKPTINENGTVKLVVSQEASSIDGSTLNNVNGPSTNKRSVESTVLVDDGAMVMLGGLMQDGYNHAQDKVPLLGDIPVVGNLFKSEKRTREKTNLMIFLRPTVMRDAEASSQVANQRYQEISALQQQSQPPASLLLRNVQEAPLLPAQPMAPVFTPAAAPSSAAVPQL